MIIGAHVVVASANAEADQQFFREVLGLTSVDAGGGDGSGYIIFGLPKSESSVHQSVAEVPHHELFFLCDDINAFAADMETRKVDCGAVQDLGWGRLVKVTLPSGAPLSVYEPRHERP